MNVLEIKNNLVKVSNETDEKLVLGGFLVIEDEKTPYVGQVISLKADNCLSYAIAKLLFTFDNEGIVKNYNGSIPKLNAVVTKLTPEELLDILPINTPLKLGNLAQQQFLLNVDSSILKNNLLVCSDNSVNSSVLISNFAKQLENRAETTIIFDIDGKFKDQSRLIFGKNFKLPLNFETINFIYGNALNDIDAASKAVIQDIFLEVQSYTRSIPEKFIPFNTFIEVVSQQYAESNVPELALLKNKLLKYKEEQVFAQSKSELNVLKEFIKDNYTVIIDISDTDAKTQKEIFFYVYDVLEEMANHFTSFVKINDENSDKKLLKMLLQKENKISTNIICNHNYKYVYELKEKCDNLILFTPETTQHDFATYNTFLNKLNHDEFIVWGSATQRIPLIVELLPLEIVTEIQQMQASMASNNTEQVNNSNNSDNTEKDLSNPVQDKEENGNDDFTTNEDTYTDLSDDIERKPVEEEDYSALEETPESPVEDEENNFDEEFEKSLSEQLAEKDLTINEPEIIETNDEASTNDFFTKSELQVEPEVTVGLKPTSKHSINMSSLVRGTDIDFQNITSKINNNLHQETGSEEIIAEPQEMQIAREITEPEFSREEIIAEPQGVQIVQEITEPEFINEEIIEEPQEVQITQEITEPEFINEEIIEEPQEVQITQEITETEFINEEIIAEPQEMQIAREITEPEISNEESNAESQEETIIEPLSLGENLALEEENNAEFLEPDYTAIEQEVILPDPKIDERIAEDFNTSEGENINCDVENINAQEDDIFAQKASPEEMTPFDNSNIAEPAPLIPDDEHLNDKLVEQVSKDIDEKFIYSKIENESIEDTSEDMLTEDDLNMIDNINQNESTASNELPAPQANAQTANTDTSLKEEVKTEAKQEATQQEVPIFEAKIPVAPQNFEQGDHVTHPKYGEGIIEKVIKYGSKTLCSVDFVNVGRRLLDPSISEITKA